MLLEVLQRLEEREAGLQFLPFVREINRAFLPDFVNLLSSIHHMFVKRAASEAQGAEVLALLAKTCDSHFRAYAKLVQNKFQTCRVTADFCKGADQVSLSFVLSASRIHFLSSCPLGLLSPSL